MRGRYLLVLGLVTVAAAGAGRQFWAPVSKALPAPERDVARAGAGGAIVAPTASDEGDLVPAAGVPTTGAARGPKIPSAPPQRAAGSARRPSRSSAGTSPVAVRRPAAPSPQPKPSPEPDPEGRAGPAPTPSGAGAATPPAAESGGGGGQSGVQSAAGSVSPDASTAGGHGALPSQPVADPVSLPPSITVAPPRLTPPRVIDTAGTEYPGEAFHVTLRHQDLGPELAVEGAEGTVVLRALVSANGSVRSVDVATSSGSPVLDQAAADAVRRWRFTPATREGAPIDAYAMLRIRYVVR